MAPSRVELEKNAFGSGLYIPWRGTYWVALIFFLKKCNSETPYWTYIMSNNQVPGSDVLAEQRPQLSKWTTTQPLLVGRKPIIIVEMRWAS